MDPKPARTISDIKPPRGANKPLAPKPMPQAPPLVVPKKPITPAPSTIPVVKRPQVATMAPADTVAQPIAKPKRRRRWLAVVFVMVALILVAAAGFAYYWFYYRTT